MLACRTAGMPYGKWHRLPSCSKPRPLPAQPQAYCRQHNGQCKQRTSQDSGALMCCSPDHLQHALPLALADLWAAVFVGKERLLGMLGKHGWMPRLQAERCQYTPEPPPKRAALKWLDSSACKLTWEGPRQAAPMQNRVLPAALARRAACGGGEHAAAQQGQQGGDRKPWRNRARGQLAAKHGNLCHANREQHNTLRHHIHQLNCDGGRVQLLFKSARQQRTLYTSSTPEVC